MKFTENIEKQWEHDEPQELYECDGCGKDVPIKCMHSFVWTDSRGVDMDVDQCCRCLQRTSICDNGGGYYHEDED